jgi:pimeloyl-ACP methyl ester carboxylesterase
MTTVVLVHGGSYTGRYWDLLGAHLHSPSVAVDLPGRGEHPADLMTVTLDDAVQAISEEVGKLDDDVVLVAHSSGGLVVPGVVAASEGRVRHVVLNAASVPPEGGNGVECMREKHRDSVRQLKALIDGGQAITTPPDPPEPERLRTAYGGDALDDRQVQFLRDPQRFVPDTYNLYFSPVHWSEAAHVPHTYVVNLRDRAVPLELQEEMIARLPAPPRVIPLDGGHMPAVTAPEVLAAIVDGIAAYPV